MYIPIGDRVLVTKHSITEDYKTKSGIILPEGFQQDDEPAQLLKIEAIGEGPACEFLNVGDMVIIQPNVRSIKVFTSKEKQLKYYIVNAAQVIARAPTKKDIEGDKWIPPSELKN